MQLQSEDKIKLIEIVYCEANDKYDLFIDDEWFGKHYTIEEALEGVRRSLR